MAVACRPIGTNRVRRLLAFETPSSTEWGTVPFVPNVFVDISKTIDAKLEAMALYDKEVREAPHPRSLEMLRSRAVFWGQVSGLHYAEPFIMLRETR